MAVTRILIFSARGNKSYPRFQLASNSAHFIWDRSLCKLSASSLKANLLSLPRKLYSYECFAYDCFTK